jgi:hypothetical protein
MGKRITEKKSERKTINIKVKINYQPKDAITFSVMFYENETTCIKTG